MLKPKGETVMPLEERVSKIEGILEQMDKRLGSIETLYNKLDNKIEALSNKITTSNQWIVGLMLGTWITIMAAIFLK